MPGWLAALLRRREATGAAVVGGVVRPVLPCGLGALAAWRRFWSVLPQARDGRPFVHATSNVLVDLACLDGVPRPLFDDAYGLSGGGDVVFFARLFARGVAMAWAEDAVVLEEVPATRASWAGSRGGGFRVGNHMVLEEERRHGRLRPALKTAGLLPCGSRSIRCSAASPRRGSSAGGWRRRSSAAASPPTAAGRWSSTPATGVPSGGWPPA